MPGFEAIGKEEQDAVNDVFNKGGVLYRYGWADKRQNIFRVDEFEKAFSQKMGIAHSLALSSGTGALKTALIGMGIKPGDEVITQSYTFIATVEAIVETGALPVITEVDNTLNMDPASLKANITDKTKAIIPVHMMGVAARMAEIMDIAKKNKLLVLEDNAQSCGGHYRGKMLGTIGDAGITSFDFGKVLTTGEGGMIMTNDPGIFKKSREYSDHGHELNPKFPRGEDTRSICGFNYKMMELQGAIGLVQLKKMDSILQYQRENKKAIKDGISDIPDIEFRTVPNPEGDIGDSVVFYLKDKKRSKQFMKYWTAKGFGTKNLPDAINWHFAGTWNHILTKYPKYKGRVLESSFPRSTDILRRAIAIPVMMNMDPVQIDRIIGTVHDCVKG